MSVVNPYYPDIDHPRYRYFKDAPDWDVVTSSHTYQDGAPSFNELSDYPRQEWELIYQFVVGEKAIAGHIDALAVFDAHFYNRRKSRVFPFTEKDGNVVANCYYKDYIPSHEGHKSWIQQRRIVIYCPRYDGQIVTSAVYYIDEAGRFMTDGAGNFYIA